MKIVSSNPTKITEFKKHLGESIEIAPGIDVKEVSGTWEEVITYKALMVGEGFVVEDTILYVNGIEMVDIKWGVSRLNEGDKVNWKTSFGYNNGKEIIVHSADIEGFVTRTRGDSGFAFDPFFVPLSLRKEFTSNLPCTLAEMEQLGRKSEFSARIRALRNLQNNIVSFKTPINQIKPWTGEWQNSL